MIILKIKLTKTTEYTHWPLFFGLITSISNEIINLGGNSYVNKNFFNTKNLYNLSYINWIYIFNSTEMFYKNKEDIMKFIPFYKFFFTDEEYTDYNRLNNINVSLEIITSADLPDLSEYEILPYVIKQYQCLSRNNCKCRFTQYLQRGCTCLSESEIVP